MIQLRTPDLDRIEFVLAAYGVPGRVVNTRWIPSRSMWKVYSVWLHWPLLSPGRELKEKLELAIGANKVELSRRGLDLEVYAR